MAPTKALALKLLEIINEQTWGYTYIENEDCDGTGYICIMIGDPDPGPGRYRWVGTILLRSNASKDDESTDPSDRHWKVYSADKRISVILSGRCPEQRFLNIKDIIKDLTMQSLLEHK